jgi:hypothetical protein
MNIKLKEEMYEKHTKKLDEVLANVDRKNININDINKMN